MIEIVKATLAILFIRGTMEQGMINGWIVRLFWSAPVWIKKPLFSCLTCMTSVWGTAAFFLFTSEWRSLHISELGIPFLQFILPLGGLLYLFDCVLTIFIAGIQDAERQIKLD